MENGLTDTNTPPIKVTYDFSKYEETFGDTSFRAFQGVPEMRDTTCSEYDWFGTTNDTKPCHTDQN